MLLGKTAGEIEAMPAAEFSEWLAYAQVEALPDPNRSAALVAFTTACGLHGGNGRRPRFDDYLPRARFDLEPIDAADAANQLIKMFGAVQKR